MVARLLADMPNPALPCRPSRDGSTVSDRVLDAANDAVCYADGRTTRHTGYAISQRIRKRIEEAFGWIKTVAGQERTKFRGRERVGWAFALAAAAYNLVRLPKLLEASR